DEGIWRRLRLVPFDVVIPVEERDEELGDRLGRELDAVLAWLVAGYQDWRQRGLDEPDRVKTATDDYKPESENLGRVLEERCLTSSPNYTVRSSVLYAEWSKWCVGEGVEPGTNKSFTTALQNRGFDTHKTNVGMVWKGIGIAAEDTTR